MNDEPLGVEDFGGDAPLPERPLVRWAGGKRKIAPHLLDYIAGRPFDRYVEPFCGGAALFLTLRAAYGDAFHATLGDTSEPLINCYREVRSRPGYVADALERYTAGYADQDMATREAHYMRTREAFNAGHGAPHERAAIFLYLNRTCFNGLWRVNRAGGFNVPFGKLKVPAFPTREHLETFSKLIADVALLDVDYGDAVDPSAGSRTVIYCDPPYDTDEEVIQFTSYASAFGWEEQCSLAGYAARWRAQGCKVIVSNRNTPRIYSLWEGLGFAIEEVEARHNIGATGDRRGNVGELIITNRT